MTGEGNPMFGKHHKQSTIDLISKKLTNHPSLKRKRTKKTRDRMSASMRKQRGKTVYQFSLDMVLVATFSCIAEAVDKTGYPRSAIKDCCNQRQKTGRGYRWSYEKEFQPLPIPTHSCNNCGIEFTKTSGNKIYCSNKCAMNGWGRTKYRKKYAEIHKEELKVYQVEYNGKNKKRIKKRKHLYYIKNKESILKKVHKNYLAKKKLKNKII